MSANKVSISFASVPYDRMQALQQGEVKAEGIDLNFISVNHPRDIFDRMSGGMEFDASELSLSEYICQYAAGKRDFTAIPVFPSRAFRHGFVAVNTKTIASPRDLNGKKIGVQLYTMTAAVWIRAVLQQHGIDLSSIHWTQGSMESGHSHGEPAVMPLVKPVDITPNETGKSLSQLLEDGEIDATIGADLPNCLGKAQHVKRLFPDFKEREKRYFKETGIFPIMHVVVVKTEILQRHPWMATSLYNALDDSKEVARLRMRFLDYLRYMFPRLPAELDEIDEVFPGGDPWVNGIEPNRKTLDGLVEALHDQGLIAEKPSTDMLFAPVRGQNWKIGLGTALVTR
ncbi:periplasmic binding protein-like II [Cryphonectria parasitica EP155]|uniref:Periplasmic binding protein-like II n=1 Tax=Cryphonectria parasitica (strain ATCC 38755 / EP155) TaxID=660469 RepID=A0A9P5CKV4_CRYP1|nr:periplasmic binding protein-like II [Cryphonectria parasitica EP155]KAF3762453.1 periplasmic binding protein-like II [Cryphonectria parasitica EP155]